MKFDRIIQEWKHRGGRDFIVTLIKKMLLPLSQFIYRVFCYLSINKDVIVFRTEIDFWDNGWALYQYLKKNQKKRYVWLVQSPKQYKKESETLFVSYDSIGLHLKACYYLARARFVFVTHGLGDLKLTRRKGQTIVNLSHGCGYKNFKGISKSLRANYDYGIVVSSFFIKSQALFLQCDEKILLPLGYPRNDVLLANLGDGQNNPFVLGEKIKKLVLWMPTFRSTKRYKFSENSCDNETGLPLLSTEEDLRSFDSFLNQLGVFILLKVHYLQAEKNSFKEHFTNIIVIRDEDIVNKGLQLYEIVGKTDALLTDYSSITTDYLLTDKPIGFILDDINSYIKDRGFAFENVTSLMPGAHIYNIEQLKQFIYGIAEDNDNYKMKRDEMRNQMHDYVDCKNSQRIAEYFGL